MRATNLPLDELHQFITEYVASHGYPPSYREMTVGIGVASTATISRYLRLLREQGRVTWDFHKSRTLKAE